MVDVTMLLQGGPAQAPAPPGAPEAPEAPAVVVGSEQPVPGRIRIERDGKVIVDGVATGGTDALGTSVGSPFPMDMPPNVYHLAKDAVIGFSLMIAAFPIFGFLKALVLRRANTQAALPSRDTTDRLQRIEAAVEAMSVEVERISEGQRFVTRVLSERSSAQG